MRELLSTAKGILLGILILLGLVLATVYGVGWIQRETAEYRGDTERIERTIADGGYQIAAYDKFYDLCHDVMGQELIIENMKLELTSNPDPARKTQVLTNIRANENTRINLIMQYNSDARKEDTKANFLASDLPYQLDPEKETTCSVESE